ncbi:MAG: GNAT family N-acetyltransferase [Spirochaetales bacterium]|nr:GNAT family N-acetyltransferase [Spirochaetales bacterium]
MEYRLLRCGGGSPLFHTLITELDRELRSHDSEENSEITEVYIRQNMVTEDVHVSLVLLGEEPAGCACLRAWEEGVFELKRMYVRPDHRGKGLSRVILQDLEDRARELGGRRIILETGEMLKAAHSLYLSAGYRRIENFGAYKDIPESLCMARDLT